MTKFNIISFLDSHAIAIPAIQRGYVHGEDTPKAKETLENFISWFWSLVSKGDGSFNLDFTYGAAEDGVAIPVDGQQRITTLWLTYLYCVHNFCPESGKEAHLSCLRRFSYSGRTSANAFCRELCQSSENFNAILRFNATRLGIEEYGEDPTISSMKRTLSGVATSGESLKQKTTWEDCLGALQRIVFEYVDVRDDLKEVSAEELYVKVNARGRTLTQWENLKGKVSDSDSSGKFKAEIEELSDKFYENHKTLPDDSFFALFARLADYALRKDAIDNEIRGNLSILAETNFSDHKVALKYVPLEEFHLEDTSKRIILPAVRMIRWALDNQNAKLWYWQKGKSVADALFFPENVKERDFTLILFEYFCKYENGNALVKDNCQALRFIVNILENVERDSQKPFSRVQCLAEVIEKAPSLYSNSMAIKTANNRLEEQLMEETAKAKIYAECHECVGLLQKCEELMHGRVRMAILDELDGKWSVAGLSRRFAERLQRMKSLFDEWNAASVDERMVQLKKLIACEPWELQDAIKLSVNYGNDDSSLRKLFSTRDDKILQHTFIDQDEKAKLCISHAPGNEWKRDWRINVFEVTDWQDREVRWHRGTGTYYLYNKGGKTVLWAMPVSDWRFDLIDDIKTFSELGDINSISINDGGTRSFKCNCDNVKDYSINIYLWKEGVEIRWFKYEGDKQHSVWVLAKDMEVVHGKIDVIGLADCIKRKISELLAKKLQRDIVQ